MAYFPAPEISTRIYIGRRIAPEDQRPRNIFTPRIKRTTPIPEPTMERMVRAKMKFAYNHYKFICGTKGNENPNYTQYEITKRLER